MARPLDTPAGKVEDPGQTMLSSPRSAVADLPVAARNSRRRPPSTEEQARRKAWGEEWSKVAKDAGQRLRRDNG